MENKRVIDRINQLIKLESTGRPIELARKLNISERTVYNLIKKLKEEYEAPIIFTNCKDEFKNFVKKNGDDLLLREFSIPPYSFPPVRINALKTNLENFETSPNCFQKYIEKKHEYRVVVIFNNIFVCKINSQDSELTKEDWRVHDDANVKWELSTLPTKLKKKIIEFKNRININWCSFDFIYGIDGEYYFLEANRPGASYWLELFIGLEIGKEIVLSIKKENIL